MTKITNLFIAVVLCAGFVVASGCEDDDQNMSRTEAMDILCDHIWEFCDRCGDDPLCDDLPYGVQFGDGCLGKPMPAGDYEATEVCLESQDEMISLFKQTDACSELLASLDDASAKCYY